MPRDWRLRIEDILDAIGKIQRYTAGMSYDEFRNDDKTVDAVVRNFQIIGEAARHIPNEIEQRHPAVPWSEMRDMRNVVIHEYFGVDRSIIWQTVIQNLPPVTPLLETLLRREHH